MFDALSGQQRQQAGDKLPATARQPAPSPPTAPVGARGRGWVHGCGRNVTSGLMIGRADHYAARSSARLNYTFGREPWLFTASQQRPPAHEGWAGGNMRAGECPRVGCQLSKMWELTSHIIFVQQQNFLIISRSCLLRACADIISSSSSTAN